MSRRDHDAMRRRDHDGTGWLRRRHYRRPLLSPPPSIRSLDHPDLLSLPSLASSPQLSEPAHIATEPAQVVERETRSKYVPLIWACRKADHRTDGWVASWQRPSPRSFQNITNRSLPPSLHVREFRGRRLHFLQGAGAAGGINMLLLGGLAIAAKLAALAFSGIFWIKTWPYLQVLSISTLLLRRPTGSTKTSKAMEVVVEPLRSLATPVLFLTIAQPVVQWISPDAYRTFRFWRRLLPIYVGYMKTKLQMRKKSLEDKDKAWAQRHEWGGEKVYHLIVDMSGFYVKSAQILASKGDFVPEAWTKHLSKMLDNVPPRPYQEVECNIRQQLASCPSCSSWSMRKGLVPLDAVFLEVEPRPLASASIAQVHGGVLKDGTRIAIKVQHTGMEMLMHSDLRNIAWLAKFLQGQLPVDLVPIVKEIQSTIPLEFNFEREVWFMNAIKKSLEANGFKQIVCPLPFMEFCSKRLIVMERVDGVPFTRILHPEAPEDLRCRIPEVIQAMEHLLRAYGQMLLIDGVFHADPHAGNLFLLPDGRLGLLDYGQQSKVIDEKLRQKLARMVLALSEDDDLAIALALLDIGIVFQPVDAVNVPLSKVAVAARILFDVCYVEEATVSPMAEQSILRTIPLKSFNQAVWMVVRTNLLLRGLCFSLKLDISAAKIWRSYAATAVQGS